MAYVSVPKDLTKVKNKVAFNLTKRQIICLGIAAVMGLPFYFLTRGTIGNSNAATGMVLLMLPAFLFAMYEKDGMPLEKVLMNIITVRFLKPDIRCYETENLYEMKMASQKPVNKKKNPQAAVKKGGQKRVRK
ncbi:MAG: PrgI family protein [Anaerotignum sp.]|nr:PrgI family protein [Anaerotignum sp.]